MRVLRGLLRRRQPGLEFLDPGGQRLDQRRLIIEKRILLGIAQSVSRPLARPYVDSHPRVARNIYLPTW